ncbi:hypothetical protein DI272_24490 [Streptomyces sp. Act143]|uniref:DUF4352 domain-containing protein n=1 Tax=Streptomyces sp. Act143 TaxID=2200760 RepID=UPI000D67DD9E|nr:DUF4352 domain-containing protein [Streptomyces sp. Act143]PWI16972.1 hypothetical protein DI272_24490 [Streptomyces sp. Act143]
MPTARRPLRLLALPLTALLLAATAGCGDDGDASGGTAQKSHKDGHLTFTLLSLQCGITGVTGSHADAPPAGQFCAARLRVANNDPNYHTYESARQRVAGVTGDRSRPDSFAMAVRRQSEKVRLGGHTLMEVELWYDVPKGAKVTGLKVSGDNDPTSFTSTKPIGRAPNGVFVPMTPASPGPTST